MNKTDAKVKYIFVSTMGKNEWSGDYDKPLSNGTDGPVADLIGARDRIRSLRVKESGQLAEVIVQIREGRYFLKEPFALDARDSGIVFTAYKGERACIDGSQRVTNWRVETINGLPVWIADLPDVAKGERNFRSLFVDNERRTRARFPQTGFYYIAGVPGLTYPDVDWWNDKSNNFIAKPGEMRAWHNLTDVDVVVPHFWVAERMPIVSYDPKTEVVTSTRKSLITLMGQYERPWSKYYLDNVFEGLTEPGRWYLDRPAGKLYYLPMPGETPDKTEVFAPCTTQLLTIKCDPDAGSFAERIRFQNMIFEHTDWDYQPGEFATANQAESLVPGAIVFEGVRNSSIENCEVRHIGGYGVEIGDGCTGIRISSNQIYDLGGGGIKMSGSNYNGTVARRTGNNFLSDNHIHHGGIVFHGAVGLILRESFRNRITHNEINNMIYSGISCGWNWTLDENVSRDNLIEGNHVHHLGEGWLGDMGAIYILGVQQGTVVRGNLVHDIGVGKEMAWGITGDAGTSNLVIENNLCYDIRSNCWGLHFGRENIVRNNIFAFGDQGAATLGKAINSTGFTFERNIVLTNGEPAFIGGYFHELTDVAFSSDLNLFWDISGKEFYCREGGPGSKTYDLKAWQAFGCDMHSVIADPKFKDLAKRDFTLAADSPAFGIGFKAFDISDAGPRKPNVMRIASLSKLKKVANALQKMEQYSIGPKQSPLANLHFSVSGDDLALTAQVYDRNIVKSRKNWDGARLEVFGAMPGLSTLRQIVFEPKGPGTTGTVKAFDRYDAPVTSATVATDSIQWEATQMPAFGYEISALIPLDALNLDRYSSALLLEVAVSGIPPTEEEIKTQSVALDVPTGERRVKKVALFGSNCPTEDNSRYGWIGLPAASHP